jgi:DNA repair protein RecO (recombination protein O)
MAGLVTEAIVLHAFDYLETSRILRLLTREAGIQSVLARGARSSRRRFGGAMDLFAQGTAEIHMRPSRELQTLASLDLTRARPELARDVSRFTGASMISEVTLRASSDEASAELFDAVSMALDRLSEAEPEATIGAALAGAWQIVAALGFTPALDVCANCHVGIDAGASVPFSHSAGGVLCGRCGASAVGARKLPPSARAAVRSWIDLQTPATLSIAEARAHQRLLREFFQEHLVGDRELRAFKVWERGEWSAA